MDHRRITALLQHAGWRVGKDRVERIWRSEGLKVQKRQKPRGRLWDNNGSCVRVSAPGFPDGEIVPEQLHSLLHRREHLPRGVRRFRLR